jgi:hypothetical protein
MVRKTHSALAESNVRFANFEEQLDELVEAARLSTKKGPMKGLRNFFKLAPTDETVFKYLESPDKEKLAKNMTQEELQLANFLQERYLMARDYLLAEGQLRSHIPDYVTHIRRSGLEAWKQDGLISAVKEMFEQYKLEEATFKILDDKTGQVLPLEKFFRFAQKRTGDMKPTENVARASKAYFMAFERKRALDSVVPELDAYVKSIQPTSKTDSGLNIDPKLKEFVYQYINTKRGRPITIAGIGPGTKPDMLMRGAIAFTRLIDLGLSIPNFVAAPIGEQSVTFINQGAKIYAKGMYRAQTAQGKKIVEKYRGFVGRSVWKEVSDSSKNLPDKAYTAMLSGFHLASVRANKQALLGALTDAEFKSGVISPERLAAIKLDSARWRAVDGMTSVLGATGFGKSGTQYKTWAVPILEQTLNDVRLASQQIAKGQFKTRETQELFREALVLGTVGLVVYSYFDEEDESYVGQMLSKASREALSAIGALNPQMWLQTPRILQYVQDIEKALHSLVMLEKYKTGDKKGTLKGDNALYRLVTPAPVRQALKASDAEPTSGLPSLPSLPTLPELPSLPELPALPKL